MRKEAGASPGGQRAEDKAPARWLNGLMYQLLVKPACWRWFRPPLGVSLLAVLRRKDHALRFGGAVPSAEPEQPEKVSVEPDTR